MKISKTAVLAMGCVFTAAGLGLTVATVVADSESREKSFGVDLNNAIQHIEKVIFISSGSNSSRATMQQVGGQDSVNGRLVGIKTDRFVLSKDENSNTIESSFRGSSILGGESNKMISGAYNVILAGSGNEMERGTNNTILGGEGNKTDGSTTSTQRSTIIGGKDNTVEGNHSVTVGGHDNNIEGNNSTVVGNNSSVAGNNSTALGLNSRINANDSFLWTDGKVNESLTADGVFAVKSNSGMVINATKAHSLAQLTIGKPMIVYPSKKSEGIECSNGNGGIMKVVKNDSSSNQVCFCSCDGSGWNSLFGARGACQSSCKGTEHEAPKCGSGFVQYTGGTAKRFSGSCEVGEVLEGRGAYFVTSDGKIHWSCQTEDGSATSCSGVINNDAWTPFTNEDHGTPEIGICTGGEVPTGGEGVKRGPQNPESNTEWKYVSGKNKLGACEWTCDDDYERVTGQNYCQPKQTVNQDPECGDNAKTHYFDSKKTTKNWGLHETRYCGAGNYDETSLKLDGNNLTWNCTGNLTTKKCTAYQQRCGDGKKNGNEDCDLGNNNGSNSSCTTSCKSAAGCGPAAGTTQYFNEKQRSSWIQSNGYCTGNYRLYGTPTIAGSGLTWQCVNYSTGGPSGKPKECKAYQQRCGDGITNDDEDCDDGTNNGKNGYCPSTCKKFNCVAPKNVFGSDQILGTWAKNHKLVLINRGNLTADTTAMVCGSEDAARKYNCSYVCSGDNLAPFNNNSQVPANNCVTATSSTICRTPVTPVDCSTAECGKATTMTFSNPSDVSFSDWCSCGQLNGSAENNVTIGLDGKWHWTCIKRNQTLGGENSTVECTAKKSNQNTTDTYTCERGDNPQSGDGVIKGSETYLTGTYQPNKWTYKTGATLSNIKPCEWTCKSGYERSGNKCVLPSTNAQCGDSNGKIYTKKEDIIYKCKNSNPSDVDTENNQFTWTCSDSYGSVPCSATKLECGSSSGQNYTSTSGIKNKCAPQSLNLDPNVNEDNGKFKWTCATGTASIECFANKTNTVCKNKLIINPNNGSIGGKTSTRTDEKDCGTTITIGDKQKSATTSTSSCSVYFYKDQNSSETKTGTITETKRWSFNKWATGGTCGALTNTQYTFPANSNGTICTITAQWKVNTTTYTTGTVTVAPLEREGYVFLGWTGPKNYSTGTYSHTPASCGEKFYAQWRKIENGQCNNNKMRGCMVGNAINTGVNKNSAGETIGVHWDCRGNDQTASGCNITCNPGEVFSLHNGECVKEDPCADYPLTSCNFPGAVYCSKCPSDSSKMKLEVCAPTYDSFAPHYDERGVTYWIKTDGTCPVGAICAPANVTWYTKKDNTCVPDEHNNKIIGCKPCYRKGNMSPSCVFDVNYCSKSCYPSLNNGGVCENAYGHNNWQNTCLAQTTEDDCKKLGAMNTNDNGTISFYRVTLPYLYGNAVACCEWAYYGG